MGAFTSVTKVVGVPPPAGGDGLKLAMGTCVGPASYDAGGSVIDLSSIFASKVYFVKANIDNADYRIQWVPGSSYATATGKLFVDNNAGTEQSGNLATALATVEWIAWGTDA
jgi:hypothetical protein